MNFLTLFRIWATASITFTILIIIKEGSVDIKALLISMATTFILIFLIFLLLEKK